MPFYSLNSGDGKYIFPVHLRFNSAGAFLSRQKKLNVLKLKLNIVQTTFMFKLKNEVESFKKKAIQHDSQNTLPTCRLELVIYTVFQQEQHKRYVAQM